MDHGDSRTPGGARTTSFSQQRLWFLDQLRPGSADYLLPMALRLRGELDIPALTGAFADVVDRHEVLRTRYAAVDGEPVPDVVADVRIPLDRVDLTGANPDDQEKGLQAVLERELRRPLDLSAAPALRLTLARLGADDQLLLVVVHHIAFDFTSWGVLTREVAAAYRERTSGEPSDLPELPFQYADFAARQRELLSGARLAGRTDYWRARLDGLAPLELPTDRPRPEVWQGDAAMTRFILPPELVGAVDAFARSRRATRFMVLLAAFQALLGRYSGQTDLAVGAPVAGRGGAELQPLIGLFVNSVVLRTDLSGQPTFGELVRRVRDSTLADFSYADAPFEHIVAELTPERDLSRNPLFQVSFLLLGGEAEPPALPGLDVELTPTPATGTPFDLVLDLMGGSDGSLSGRMQYATALFDAGTMRRLADGYAELLRGVLAAPDAPLAETTGRIAPLPGKERQRLLALGDGGARPVPELTADALFERQARSTPYALAVRSAGTELTYAGLDARANQLAHRLRALGAGPGVRVGIHLERGANLVAAVLAVFKAGAVYLPLDPIHPDARLAALLADTGARLVITEEPLAGRLTGTGVRTVLLDRDRAEIEALPTAAPGRTAGPQDLAYIFHTSGSTGRPKGVLIPHHALTNFLVSMARRLGIRPGDAVMGVTTVSFDPSLLELCLPLTTGAHVVVADAEQARDPQRLTRLIDEVRPAVLQATPVALRMLTDTGWTPPPTLTVLSGGEKLPPGLVHALDAHGAPVWDLYGPTETTVWTTAARVGADGRPDDWAVLDNTTVRLLDERLEPVPHGATGEIHIGGAGVGWGYHGQPEQTAGAFLPDPYAAEPGGRLYATGDLGRLRPDGSLEILGRRDHQVKIHGHRMEPGEIEAALLAVEAVRAAVVHPTPGGSGEPQLTAYLVAREGHRLPGADELRDRLLETLPDYMIPASFMPLDELPTTVNGKVDRKALPLPHAPSPAAAAADHLAPRSPEEKAVAEVWQTVLGVPRVGAHDDFFRLGGHSLLATRVSVRLRGVLGIDVPVRALFDHTTVAALAGALDDYPRVSVNRPMPVLTGRRRTGR
ncbi:amino acid adenylation domain-containing protein [Streptomyces sp. NPDC058280]|uniref:amino acid adenylation domain-containing protein n=1 Tax=Streptomyces sp. NPDC058280 TaxID=3346419 RepID=UPI0036F01A8A